MKVNKADFLDPQEYETAIGALRAFTIILLISLNKTTEDHLKDQIIPNFIARGAECLDSILLLWKGGRYDDCVSLHRTHTDRVIHLMDLIESENFAEFERWYDDCVSLHRTHTDRVIHLMDLIESENFAEFERWSFRKKFEMTDRSLSDPMIHSKVQPAALKKARELHQGRRIRFNQEPESTWHRPDPEEVAKRSKFPILYKLGYDYPSTEIHPMADDGKDALDRLINAETELPSSGDDFVVLQNSFANQIYLVIIGFDACNVVWDGLVGGFLDQLLSLLESGSKDYMLTFLEITGRGMDHLWCRPKDISSSPL